MRRDRHAGIPRHARDPEEAVDTADVADVRLRHVHRPAVNQVLPEGEVVVLFAARHVEIERLLDRPRPVRLPIGAGLLEVAHRVFFQEPAERDCLIGHVAAVRVDQQGNVIAEHAANLLHDRLGAARPLVLPAAAFRAHPELEGVESVAVA